MHNTYVEQIRTYVPSLLEVDRFLLSPAFRESSAKMYLNYSKSYGYIRTVHMIHICTYSMKLFPTYLLYIYCNYFPLECIENNNTCMLVISISLTDIILIYIPNNISYRIAPNFRGLIFSWSLLIFVIHRRFVILGVSSPVLKGAAKNFS